MSLARLDSLFLSLCLLVLLSGCFTTRDGLHVPSQGLASAFRTAPQSTAPASSQIAQLQAAYGKLPLSFEANQGQTDAQVAFLARGKGYTLFLTATEAVLTLRHGEKAEGREQKAASVPTIPHSAIRNPQSAVLRMQLVGGNPRPHVTGAEELPGTVNYFQGNDPTKWRTNVPAYARVHYQDVYPGVDLVYYGNQGQLEHDFLVAPGADPAAIRLAVEGADTLDLDAQGDLVLRLAGGEVRLPTPHIYQEVDGVRHEIPGGYVLTPQSPIRNPHSPIPNSQSPLPNPQFAIPHRRVPGGCVRSHQAPRH